MMISSPSTPKLLRRLIPLGCTTVLALTSAQAGPRNSTHYAITTDSADAAGRRTSSAHYANDGSAGGITGVSSVTSPAQKVKHGYIGQLYEATGLHLVADPLSVNEEDSLQLGGLGLLDDLTTIRIDPATITWSVLTGPLTIDTNGLAIADAVYQDTAATAQGVFAGFTSTLGLTVINTDNDNFGTYAADGIADEWQVQYFGIGNPNAGPLSDPDHDGQNNLFEFTAGIIPTDSLSAFRLRIEPVIGQPTQKNLILSPRLAGRTYAVKSSTTLGPAAVWTPLSGSTTSDLLTERTVTDTAATEDVKFYTVEIVKP